MPRASGAVTSVGERSAEQQGSKGRKKKQLLSGEFDLLQGRRAFINKVPGSHALSPVFCYQSFLHLDTYAHTHGHTQRHMHTLMDTHRETHMHTTHGHTQRDTCTHS